MALISFIPINGNAHHSNPEWGEWMAKQQNMIGTSCCDGTDAYVLEQDEWKIENGIYKVSIEGKWYDIRPHVKVNLIHGPNPTGKAVVWYSKVYPDGIPIYCFTPGTMF